jgi:hypothetical protein
MDCKILVSYYVSGYRGAVQQCYKWQKSVRSWTMDLKEELSNTGLAFVWTKQQQCNLREITKIVKGRCNDTDRQNILHNCQRKAR